MPWGTPGYSRSIMPQLQGSIESAPCTSKMKKKYPDFRFRQPACYKNWNKNWKNRKCLSFTITRKTEGSELPGEVERHLWKFPVSGDLVEIVSKCRFVDKQNGVFKSANRTSDSASQEKIPSEATIHWAAPYIRLITMQALQHPVKPGSHTPMDRYYFPSDFFGGAIWCRLGSGWLKWLETHHIRTNNKQKVKGLCEKNR